MKVPLQPPPIELIESNHPFPGSYTFKVIGLAEDEFARRAIEAAKIAAGQEEDPRHSLRISEGGRHIALTLEMALPSAKAVHEVYHGLAALKGLVLLL